DSLEAVQIPFRRDAQHLRPNLHRRGRLHQLGSEYRKIEQEIDPEPGCRVEEVRSDRRINAQTAYCDPPAVDRRDHVSDIVHTRRQLEAAIVEDSDDFVESIVWSC